MKSTQPVIVLSLSLILALSSLGLLSLIAATAQAAAEPPLMAGNDLSNRVLLQATRVVTLNPGKDNTLYEDPEGDLSNGAGQHLFAGRSQQEVGLSIRRGVLAFDVAGRIPAGAIIVSATLKLNLSRALEPATRTVSLHRLLEDWGEGDSAASGLEGMGAPAATGDATWRHRFFTATLWSTPGGVFSSTARASVVVGGNNAYGFYEWGSTPEMVADVQSWLDAPAGNFGWLLMGDESAAGTARSFDAGDHLSPANRPLLSLTFIPPEQVFLPLVVK